MKYYRHRFDNIEDYLHHRKPYLMVDGIDTIEEKQIETYKNVTLDDAFLAGHFPGAAVFPGAMMQELVTQSGGVLIAANYNPMESYNTADPHHNEFALGVLIRVRGARYRGFARPGDRLRACVKLNDIIGNLFDFSGKIFVEQQEIMRIEFGLSNILSSTLTQTVKNPA